MDFIHIADVHLGLTPDATKPWSEKRAEEIWETFKRVIIKCNEKHIDLLLIAGDLFHRQPLKKELKEVDYLFSTLKKTKVVLIAGNHDYVKNSSYYNDFVWSQNVTMLIEDEIGQVYFPDINTKVWGFSYHNYEITNPKYDDLRIEDHSCTNILLAHGGDERHVPIDFRKLTTAGFDYVALGHIHKPDLKMQECIAYAGSLEPTDKNDVGVHGFVMGQISQGITQFKFVPFACREYVSLRIKLTPATVTGALVDRVTEAIDTYGREHIYKIYLEGSYDPDVPIDHKRLELAGNIIEIKDESVPKYNIELLKQEHKDDVVGMYIQSFLSEPLTECRKKALYYGIHAMLSQLNK